MKKEELTKAQQDLVDHIEAGQQDPKLVKILTEENEALKKNRPLDTMDEIAYRELELKYKKEHKLRQEAEGEMTILKTISVHSSPEMKAATLKIDEMRKELDRVKLDNNNLYTRVADALEVNEHHQNLNGKLQVRITDLEDDNQKISKQIEDQLDRARKAGL